jgi:hypothetical protein
MTNDEAKFILSAYRPNGSDAGNGTFSEPLRMAASDPLLAAWFERSRSHDLAVAAKLAQIMPSAGLREAILAGARVSESQRERGRRWAWVSGLSVAAAISLIVFSMKSPVRPDAPAEAYAGFAINDMVSEKHGGHGAPASALVASLQEEGAPMPGAGAIDFEKLKDTGCRTLRYSGHEVIEVCFVRDGALFHLYVSPRLGGVAESSPSFIAQAAGAAAVWSDRSFDYALASSAGIASLRKLL